MSADFPSPGFGTSFESDSSHEPLPRLGPVKDTDDVSVTTAAVTAALHVGYRHIDTADMYGNETEVRHALELSEVEKNDVFVATKVKPENLAYDDVIASAEQSRERLGVDTLDLLYLHWPIRTYDPEETLAAFEELYDRGVIERFGLSNFTPSLLEDALSRLDIPVFAHQVECHPLLPQQELRKYAREHGHYLVAYSPVAKGAVFDEPVLQEIAEAHDATPAQVSLAWLHSKERVVPIPRSSTAEHIKENFDAQNLTLTEDEIARIDRIETRDRQIDFEDAPWNC